MPEKKTPAKKQNTTTAARRTSPLTSLPFMGPVLTLGQTIFGGGDPDPQRTAQQRGRAALVVNKTTGSDIANEVGSVVTGAASSAGRKAAGGEVNRKTVKEDMARGHKQVQDDIALYKKNNPTEAALVENTIDGLGMLVGAQAAKKLAIKYLGKNGAGIGQLIKDGAKYVLPGAGGGAVIGASLDGDTKDRAVNALKEGGLGAALGVVLGPAFDRNARKAGVEIIPGPAPAPSRTNAPQLASPRAQQPQVIEGRATVVNDGTVVRGQAPERKPALAAPPTETRQVTHRSKNPALTEVDPKMFGTNRQDNGNLVTGREERSKVQTSTGGRSYFGSRTGEPGGYVDEKGLGPFEYSADIPKHRYLETDGPSGNMSPEQYDDFLKKADYIRSNPDLMREWGLPIAAPRSVVVDRLIKNAGYDGIVYEPGFNQKYGNPLGETVVHWGDPVPVNRTTPTIPEDFLPQNVNNAMKRDDWAMITGENPDAIGFTPEINATRNAALEQKAREAGAEVYPAQGFYGDNPENSYLVSPINQEQALRLGGDFNQDSVLTNRGLLYQDGNITPAQGVNTFDTAPENYYTRLPTQNSGDANFAVDLGDFSKLPDYTRVPGDYPVNPYVVPEGVPIPPENLHRFDQATRTMYPEGHPDIPNILRRPLAEGMRVLTPEETQMVSGGASTQVPAAGGGGLAMDAEDRAIAAQFNASRGRGIYQYGPEGGYGNNVTGYGYEPQYSKLRTAPKPGEVDVTVKESNVPMADRKIITPSDLQGSVILSGQADRTRAGGILTEVNGQPLVNPVNLQGGQDFMRQQASLGHNSGETSVWASAPGVVTGFGKIAREAAEKGLDTYFAPWTMAATGSDYSHMPAGVISNLMRNVPKDLRKQFDKEMREKFPKFAGTENISKLEKQLAENPAARYELMKMLDTSKWQKLGMPSPALARIATTEPALVDVPSGTFGYNVGKIDPSGSTIDDPMLTHETYKSHLKGKYHGSLESPVHAEVFLGDEVSKMKENPKFTYPNIEYNLKRGQKVQYADQEWVDKTSAEIERLKRLGIVF